MNFGVRLAPVVCPKCSAVIGMGGMIESDPEMYIKECRKCHSMIVMRYDRTTGHTIVEEVKAN
jgi:hypothetical protein